MSIDNSLNPNSLFNNIQKQSNLPVEQWDPPYCGEIDIQIKSDGTWLYMGSVITRQSLVKLFSNVLKKEGAFYYLVTPVEKVKINVHAEPFLIVDFEQDLNSQLIMFRTNLNDVIVASKSFPLTVTSDAQGNPYPTLLVRNNLYGLLTRSVFYQLVEIAEQEDNNGFTRLFINSGDYEIELGRYEI